MTVEDAVRELTEVLKEKQDGDVTPDVTPDGTPGGQIVFVTQTLDEVAGTITLPVTYNDLVSGINEGKFFILKDSQDMMGYTNFYWLARLEVSDGKYRAYFGSDEPDFSNADPDEYLFYSTLG